MHTYVYIIFFRIHLICGNVKSRAEKFASMCMSRAESQNKEALVVTSVVTTIQWFYARDVHSVTRDQLIYHKRYYKIYFRTRFHIGYECAFISCVFHVRIAKLKNYT